MDEEKMLCDNCEITIIDERESYHIEYFDIYWCDECMMKYMDGPQDDLVDDLADDLKML